MNYQETFSAGSGVEGKSQPGVPSLILLKAGNDGPPIFMAHGLGGVVGDLLQLASHLRVSQPIYGMQEKGANEGAAPLEQVEAMAEFHLAAIRQVQSRGPYFLIGYSLGGLVSLEIARRLLKSGEQIALLALLDSYPYRTHLPFGQYLRLLLRRAGSRTASGMAAERFQEGIASDRRRCVRDAQIRAWKKYRPQFYDGTISFVKPALGSFLPDDPAAVWSSLAREFRAETVPGDHLGLLTSHCAAVGQALLRYMNVAPAASSDGH